MRSTAIHSRTRPSWSAGRSDDRLTLGWDGATANGPTWPGLAGGLANLP